MNKGWVRLYRNMMKWEWYQDSEATHLFIHLLLKANHASCKWKGTEVKRGQLITGRKVLHRETGISENKIRQRLKWFEDTQEITIKTTSKFSLITILKYNIYQPEIDTKSPTSHQQTTSKPPANHHKQEEEEYKEEKEVVESCQITSGLPDFLQ